MLVATHSGPFHADDVFAFALIDAFLEKDATLVRTRDLETIAAADIAIDVGGEYAPERGRFDHHQRAYEGTLSSAGMVLLWLEQQSRVSLSVAARLREDYVDYIDAVDTGRRKPERGVPCISSLVGTLAEQAQTAERFDIYYRKAAEMCSGIIAGVVLADEKARAGRAAVSAAMREAERTGSRILRFDRHYKWKRAYFDQGGATHPSDYVLFPDGDSWRIIAIPPEPDSFAQKRPLPAPWAGLTDEALCQVVGVPGARFCHKNRFIAVFESETSALQAIERWSLASRPPEETS